MTDIKSNEQIISNTNKLNIMCETFTDDYVERNSPLIECLQENIDLLNTWKVMTELDKGMLKKAKFVVSKHRRIVKAMEGVYE